MSWIFPTLVIQTNILLACQQDKCCDAVVELSCGSTKRGSRGGCVLVGCRKDGNGDDGGWSEGQSGRVGIVVVLNYRESETDRRCNWTLELLELNWSSPAHCLKQRTTVDIVKCRWL